MASEAKRPKVDHSTVPPSKTLMVQNLPPDVDEKDLVVLFGRYGNIIDLLKVSMGKSCLVEFEDIEVAKMMLEQTQNSTFYVGQTPVRLLFATCECIKRYKGNVNSTANVMAMLQQESSNGTGMKVDINMGSGAGDASISPTQTQVNNGLPPIGSAAAGGSTNQNQPMGMLQQQMATPQLNPNYMPPQPNMYAAAPQPTHGLPGRVLLFSIAQAVFPITVDVMKTICSSNGTVLRISIGAKKADNSLEALVEFESVGDANRAVENLNGADIYSGCCTLTITVSHLPVLQVYKNDQFSFDYVNPNLGAERTGLLGSAPPNMSAVSQVGVAAAASYNNTVGIVTNTSVPPPPSMPSMTYNESIATPFVSGEGTVIMAYNLPPGLNCQMIFNIFCLFGNVAKIKFLKSREGCVMIQMGNPEYAHEAVTHLGGITLMGKKIEVCKSKQPEVKVHPVPDRLPDGSPLNVDYIRDINNRFRNSETIKRARILAPCETLHFFNTPPNSKEDDIIKLFVDAQAPVPTRAIVFPSKPGAVKAALGLISFDTIEESILAVVRVNHYEIDLGKQKYHLKLSFSNKGIDVGDPKVCHYSKDGIRISGGTPASISASAVVKAAPVTSSAAMLHQNGNDDEDEED